MVEKYFVSGGFAFIHPDSSADICAVEAVKVADLDADAVRAGLQVRVGRSRRRDQGWGGRGWRGSLLLGSRWKVLMGMLQQLTGLRRACPQEM